MPVEFDPSSSDLKNWKTNYLRLEVVFNNLDAILQGVLITIALALLAEVLGIVLGLGARPAQDQPLADTELARPGLHRRVPGDAALVQITIIYFTTASVGIRFESLFFAGLVALSLNSAAYVAKTSAPASRASTRGK